MQTCVTADQSSPPSVLLGVGSWSGENTKRQPPSRSSARSPRKSPLSSWQRPGKDRRRSRFGAKRRLSIRLWSLSAHRWPKRRVACLGSLHRRSTSLLENVISILCPRRASSLRFVTQRRALGRVPSVLQMMPSMISSAPAPMEASRTSRYMRLMRMSRM